MYKHLLAVVLANAALSTQAQVRVVESSPQSVRSGVSQLPVDASGAQTDIYSELQALKFEIANLRGLVEEQAYELSKLKELQMDGYVDLDRRISALNGSAPVAPLSASSSSSVKSTAVASASVPLPPSDASDAEVYAAAYDLLRSRQYDAAIIALDDYLKRFPSGAYAGNSYYWLGEIYLLKENLPEAKNWFSKLLADFPQDRKVPDAKFKLGKVFYLQGDLGQARSVLQDAAAGNSDAARLAKQYLQDNF